MHAAVVRANVPGGVNDARLTDLKERTAPMVSSAPGFVAAYWLDVVDDQGLALVVFEDEAAARASAPPAGSDMGNGVTIESVEFRAALANG